MNNKKLTFTLGSLLIILVLVLLMLPSTAGAAQSTTPTPPNATWSGNFVVRPDLQYAWLRVAPFSSASVVATAYPNQIVTATTSPDGQTQVWDGIQWWGYVSVPTVAVSGWVEITSLQAGLAPTATPTTAPQVLATWGNSTAVRVKASVIFLWLRQRPASDAVVLFQVPAGSVMVTIAPPQSDGVQNWWPMLDVQSGVMGWAEQNSLEPASIGADIASATLTPVPTSQSWQSGNKVRVRDDVTAGWVRVSPSLRARMLVRVIPGNILDLVGTPAQFADGDWWWLVKTRGTNITGWIQQSALDIAPSDA